MTDDHASAPPPAARPTEPWVPMLMVLTFTSGIVDAVSFLSFGRVFTALMTGNVAFIGFAIAGAEGLQMGRSIVALCAFFAGAVLGGRVAHTLRDATHRRWLSWAGGLEVMLLVAAVVFALIAGDAPPSELVMSGMIVGTAGAMGVRSATALKLKDPEIKTTVLTLAIAGMASNSSLAGGTNPRWAKRLISIVMLFLGAITGGVLLKTLGVAAALGTVAVLVVVATALYTTRAASAERTLSGAPPR